MHIHSKIFRDLNKFSVVVIVIKHSKLSATVICFGSFAVQYEIHETLSS